MAKEKTTITMATPLLEQLRTTARAERRNVSQQLEVILANHFGIAEPVKAPRKRKGVAA